MREFVENRGAFREPSRIAHDASRAVLLMGVILLALLSARPSASASELKRDDTVIFFPTLGCQARNGWELDIHGWVFESEKHRLLTALFRRAIGIHENELTADEKSVFARRSQF